MGFQRSSFTPHPEGLTIGTFVDHVAETGQFGPQTRLSFDTDELMDDGRPFRVVFWITTQINPKSNAYKFLKAMGIDVDGISDEELEALDLDNLLHKRCQLVIEHKKKPDGTVQAKVANLLPLKAKRPAANAAPKQELVGAGAGAVAPTVLWPAGDD